MATKKNPEHEQDPAAEGILKKAAKAVGSALGVIAKKTGIAQPDTPPKKSGKLVKKMKHRLPRKEKKQAKKAAAAAAISAAKI